MPEETETPRDPRDPRDAVPPQAAPTAPQAAQAALPAPTPTLEGTGTTTKGADAVPVAPPSVGISGVKKFCEIWKI